MKFHQPGNRSVLSSRANAAHWLASGHGEAKVDERIRCLRSRESLNLTRVTETVLYAISCFLAPKPKWGKNCGFVVSSVDFPGQVATWVENIPNRLRLSEPVLIRPEDLNEENFSDSFMLDLYGIWNSIDV